MTSINALQAVPQQKVAFKGNEENEKHPGAAVASFLLPGSGQFIKGDTSRGFAHLGIQIGVAVASFLLISKQILKNIPQAAERFMSHGSCNTYRKECLAGISKTRWVAFAGVAALGIGNLISSIANAYQPSKKTAE